MLTNYGPMAPVASSISIAGPSQPFVALDDRLRSRAPVRLCACVPVWLCGCAAVLHEQGATAGDVPGGGPPDQARGSAEEDVADDWQRRAAVGEHGLEERPIHEARPSRLSPASRFVLETGHLHGSEVVLAQLRARQSSPVPL